ncbi:hypothetical protein M9458_002489 [Cirrhinus mrigala]|uniref:Uncharacterized protein n=1 Tax=Cirrhinus mrigala TaxID=683832 RepID=A0ABD0S1L3_CIRMR
MVLSPALSSVSAVMFGVYVPLCCFHQEGRAQSAPSDCGFSEQDGSDGPLLRPKDFLTLLRENLREQFSSPAHVPTHTCPPEVEELKTDFNRRIKEVLFNSLFSAYYVAFLPLCFVKSSLYGPEAQRLRTGVDHSWNTWVMPLVIRVGNREPVPF